MNRYHFCLHSVYLVFAYVYMVESRTEAYVYLMKFPENVGNKLLKEKKKTSFISHSKHTASPKVKS